MKKISTMGILIMVFLLGVYGSTLYKEFNLSIPSLLNVKLNDPTRKEFEQGKDTKSIKNMMEFNEGTLPTSQLYLTKMYEEYEKELNDAKTVSAFKDTFNNMAFTLTRAAMSFKSGASVDELENAQHLIEKQLDKLQQKAHYLNQQSVTKLTNESQQKDFLMYNQLYKEIKDEQNEIERDIERLKKQIQAILTDKMDTTK